MEKILEVKNISKTYQNKEGEVLALENVNFKVRKGEFVSIIGPSGCGKSTLLSIIAGLESKTTGEIYIEGEKEENISQKVGYMLQRDCLLEWRNILNNTMFGLEIKLEEGDKNMSCLYERLVKEFRQDIRNEFRDQRLKIAKKLMLKNTDDKTILEVTEISQKDLDKLKQKILVEK